MLPLAIESTGMERHFEDEYHDDPNMVVVTGERTLEVLPERHRKKSFCSSFAIVAAVVISLGTGFWIGSETSSFNDTSPSAEKTISCFRPVVDILHLGKKNVHPPQPWSMDEHGNELQGLTVLPQEPTILYQGRTHSIQKLRMDLHPHTVLEVLQERHYNQSIEFPLVTLSNGVSLPIAHFGGIAIIETPERGKEVLFAAHTELDNHFYGGGLIVAVDAETLEFRNTTVAHNPYAAHDWVAVDHTTGIGYTGTFFNVTKAMRFRLDTLEDLEPLEFRGTGLPIATEGGINYVQSATIYQSALLLGTNDFQGSLYYVDTSTGRIKGRQSLLLGNEMDGLVAIDEDKLLVGYNRWNSHEHIDLQSIVLLRADRERLDETTMTACGGAYVHFVD